MFADMQGNSAASEFIGDELKSILLGEIPYFPNSPAAKKIIEEVCLFMIQTYQYFVALEKKW